MNKNERLLRRSAKIIIISYPLRSIDSSWNYRSTVAIVVSYVTVTNNLIGLIFTRVGYRDLGIYFGNKPSL